MTPEAPQQVPIDLSSIHLDISMSFGAWQHPIQRAVREIRVEISASMDQGAIVPTKEQEDWDNDQWRNWEPFPGIRSDESFKIGELKAYFIDFERISTEDIWLGDALGSESWSDAYACLFNSSEGFFADPINSQLIAPSYRGGMVLHELSIDPRFQGQDAGVHAMLQFMKSFEYQVDAFVLKPFPLQYGGGEERYDRNAQLFGRNATEMPLAEAQSNLSEHYKRLGFEPCLDGKFMFFDTALEMPEPEQLMDARSRKKKATP